MRRWERGDSGPERAGFGRGRDRWQELLQRERRCGGSGEQRQVVVQRERRGPGSRSEVLSDARRYAGSWAEGPRPGVRL